MEQGGKFWNYLPQLQRQLSNFILEDGMKMKVVVIEKVNDHDTNIVDTNDFEKKGWEYSSDAR